MEALKGLDSSVSTDTALEIVPTAANGDFLEFAWPLGFDEPITSLKSKRELQLRHLSC